MNDLRRFLDNSARLPFVWGERDCALWVCDWLKIRHGIDPGSHLRGTYRTERECLRLLIRAGGLERLAGDCFAVAGLVETNHPVPGDVGAIEFPTGVTLAIKASRLEWWAAKAPDGVMIAGGRVLRAWALRGMACHQQSSQQSHLLS